MNTEFAGPLFEHVLAPVVVAGLAGGIAVLAQNATRLQRLRRGLQNDAKVLELLPPGETRSLLGASFAEDAKDYAIRRALGPGHWAVWVLRVMSAASLVMLIPLVQSELLFASIGMSTPLSWVLAITPAVSTAGGLLGAAFAVETFTRHRREDRLRRLETKDGSSIPPAGVQDATS